MVGSEAPNPEFAESSRGERRGRAGRPRWREHVRRGEVGHGRAAGMRRCTRAHPWGRGDRTHRPSCGGGRSVEGRAGHQEDRQAIRRGTGGRRYRTVPWTTVPMPITRSSAVIFPLRSVTGPWTVGFRPVTRTHSQATGKDRSMGTLTCAGVSALVRLIPVGQTIMG